MDARSVRVPEERIKENLAAALGIVREAEAPAPKAERPVVGRISMVPPISGGASARKTRENLEAALKAEADGDMLSPERYAVLHAARRAVAVGMTVSEMFVEPLGYLDLGGRNRSGTLHGQDLDRFKGMVRAKAAVAAFAAAAHLASTRQGTASGLSKPAGEVPETTSEALGWFVHRLVEAVRGVKDEEIEGAVAQACADVMDAVENGATRALGQFVADYGAVSYAVEADSFHVHGFSRPGARRKATVDIQFKKPEEVVGNHIAKSQAMRLAKMLACYDFDAKKNPFVELGGFIFTFIGDGNPGTGKTTLIQMAAGLIKQYCDVGGYGFHFENFGVDQISEFQGKSGQNARAFIDRVIDPRTIGFGTIDDVDQVAGKRDDQRSSGGQQEVTAVLMDAFAGAGTVVRGNCTFGMFSNYPEKVDDALRQRAGARWLVDGPQTEADYIDIASLLLGKNHSIPLGDHDLFAAQEIKKMVAASYDGFSEPKDGKLRSVWDAHVSRYGPPSTIADVGRYLHAIKELEPRFTGRAIKNVMDAVKLRAMDFELPDEWFETPQAFMARPYAEKLRMVQDLRAPITIDMVIQETNRYAESELRYSDKSDEAAIAARVRDMKVTVAANQRFQSEHVA